MSKLIRFIKKIDWVNTSFLLVTPAVALFGTGVLCARNVIPIKTLVLALVFGVVTGLSVTGGYHRLFAHKSYEANWIIRLFFLIFGAASFENSARRWCADHRTHHKYVDTERDPYNIKRGFWYAHMGWVMLKTPPPSDDNIQDILADPLVRWQDRFYVWIGIAFGFLLPMGIASLWGDPWGGLIVAGFARTVLNHHFTFSINSFCHLIGRRPYSDLNTARDSWFVALFTYGEGYHNFHHKFPADYRNGIRVYHWDPTKWLIRALAWVGWTYQLRQMPEERIIQARLRMEEKRVLRKVQERPSHARLVSRELVMAARLRFEDSYRKFQALKTEYRRLKETRVQAFNTQIAHLNHGVDKIREDLRISRQKLEEAMAEWKRLCRQFGVRPTRLALDSSFA